MHIKTDPIRVAVFCVALTLSSHGSVFAQEPPIERELEYIELQVRIENYKQTAMEMLQTRKQLALVHQDTGKRELVERLERLEIWQETLTEEIHKLAEMLHKDPSSPERRREEGSTDRQVPQGLYALELNFEPQGGERVQTNIEIRGNEVRCVSASDKRFIGMAGRVEPRSGNQVMVRMRNNHHAASQIWERVNDGHWRVLEIPDRGEKQVAKPVDDGRIE